jgi:N-acetyl-anhydromuramyl-L-alanine amidase AmpD
MLQIDEHGKVVSPKIKDAISPTIEHGDMPKVSGIIVHQTDSPTARATLNSYASPKANGAHFLIDKDGTVYQTASVYKRTYHVGKLRSRCYVEMRCTPAEMKANAKWNPDATYRRELKKSVPDRYPSNDDAIGIEIVGKAYPSKENPKNKVYEPVTARQQQSLKWLIDEISQTLKVPLTEIFRHPTVSHKEETEAGSAQW